MSADRATEVSVTLEDGETYCFRRYGDRWKIVWPNGVESQADIDERDILWQVSRALVRDS